MEPALSRKSGGIQIKGNYEPARVLSRVVSGDFTNDGKDDVAVMYDYLNKQAQVHLFTSSGSSFSRSSLWDSGKGNYSAASVASRITSGDFTGNKKSDIVTLYDYMKDSGRLHVFKNEGSKLKDVTWWDSGDGNYSVVQVLNRVEAGDFNGDGVDEVATFYDYLNKQAKIHVFVAGERESRSYSSLQDCIDKNTPVYFVPDRGNMLNGESDKLWEIIDYINNNLAGESVKLLIEGHTASVGKPDGEQSLSKLRADVVRVYLRKRIKNADVTYEMAGLGSTRLVSESAAERQKNRRVEVSIIE
jgi:outer membrane protein OmpA-like peptidoglycan-associated protein